jgi:hypothetical protein
MANPSEMLATAIDTILLEIPFRFSRWENTLRAMNNSVFNK